MWVWSKFESKILTMDLWEEQGSILKMAMRSKVPPEDMRNEWKVARPGITCGAKQLLGSRCLGKWPGCMDTGDLIPGHFRCSSAQWSCIVVERQRVRMGTKAPKGWAWGWSELRLERGQVNSEARLQRTIWHWYGNQQELGQIWSWRNWQCSRDRNLPGIMGLPWGFCRWLEEKDSGDQRLKARAL